VSPSGCARSDDVHGSKRFDISHRRLAEETAVFAIELAHTFVADFVRRACGIYPIHKHPLPCSLQPKLLLILKRAHRGQCAELMVKCRNPHSRDPRQLLHVQRLRIVVSQPGNRSRRSVAEIARCCNSPEPRPLRTSQDAVNDFALDQVAQKRDVFERIKKFQKS
jgi:hypothetical protein